MTHGPEPRASLRGFMALVLDMVRVDPDRRPSVEVRRWHRDIEAAIGAAPEYPRTNRELLGAALRLARALDQPGDEAPPPAYAEAGPPLDDPSGRPATIAAGSPTATSR